MSYAKELSETARCLLLQTDNRSPTVADCNRAASTIYYALFDCICDAVASRIVGRVAENCKPSAALTTVYRSVDHAALEAALFRVKMPPDDGFSYDAKTLAAIFKRLRDEQTKADYDRAEDVDFGTAKQLLEEAEIAFLFIDKVKPTSFDFESWLSNLITELFFSRSKR